MEKRKKPGNALLFAAAAFSTAAIVLSLAAGIVGAGTPAALPSTAAAIASAAACLLFLTRDRASARAADALSGSLRDARAAAASREALLRDLAGPLAFLSRERSVLEKAFGGPAGTGSARYPEAPSCPEAGSAFDALRAYASSVPKDASPLAPAAARCAGLGAAFADGVGGLHALELRLPYVQAIHGRVVDHTEKAANVLLERFGAIAERAEKAEKEAEKAMGCLSDASGDGLEGLIGKSRQAVLGNTAVIKEFLSLNRENADRVRKMSDLVARSEELIRSIEEIAEHSKIISFNLAVESAKIGEKGAGFKVIVAELQRLNDQTTSFARDIMEIVKAFRTHNQELLDQWLVKTEALTETVREDTDQAEVAVEALSRSYDVAGSLFKALSESAIGVSRSMGDILQSLQFQDITRQQIEGAGAFVEDVRRGLEGLRKAAEGAGVPASDTRALLIAIRAAYQPKLKVSSDHDIFDEIERRSV